MTNAAVREQEALETGCPTTEMPALLVPGGSRSHLCRAPRARFNPGSRPDIDNRYDPSETAPVERN